MGRARLITKSVMSGPQRQRLWWLSGRKVALLAGVVVLLALPACSTLFVRHARHERAHLGDELYRQTLGEGSKTIVFVPGLMGSTAFWESGVRPELSAQYRLVLIDLLGFGRSPWPDSDYTLEDQLAALRRTLVKEDATRDIVLAAHSLGTVVAAHYAERYPGEVKQLFLFGTPIYENERDAAARIGEMSSLASLLMRSPLAARVVCMLHNAIMPLGPVLAPHLRPELPSEVASDGALHFWPSLHGSVTHVILDKPIQEPLRMIGPRTIIILGDEDGISDASLVNRVASRTGARLIRTHGDHSSYWHTYADVLLENLVPKE